MGQLDMFRTLHDKSNNSKSSNLDDNFQKIKKKPNPVDII